MTLEGGENVEHLALLGLLVHQLDELLLLSFLLF